ncbi:acyl-CoA dehydrogenase [candidate division KSB3 bacterium]|uniref:Acyl-CoA dehydrogenase n=1 Tax=candidate division KSB3 bacterium TaxID=2044937 RepID=A0A9D5Q7V5_9BACT|nr:acyl-CoA dehydrogenase [candidate division KSB3 bacterium]MBD3327269.1 acyl-CoA dehydrogenase [candidate division KSB3 bacterium]
MPNFYQDNDDILFHFRHIDLDQVIELKEDHFADKDHYDYAPRNLRDAKDSYDRILDIVGDIAGNIIAPKAAEADEEGAQYENGNVTYAKATQEAIEMLTKADLMGFTLPRKYDGLNCPITIYAMAIEIVSRAEAGIMNIFGLQDIAETINKFADEEVKAQYLPRFSSGEVTGSMALTEPDAGSDLQAIQLKAFQDDDGKWYLNGVKRFITNGCGQISLVLARSEEGTKDGRGLSMFLYERDEHMRIRRIENKLGIHASPTTELQFNNAPAVLIGKRKMGLIRYVMSLMNGARLAIAAQGVGIAEAAYQSAKKYAQERVQFKRAIRLMVPVYEMLARMKVKTEAARTLMYETAKIVDIKDGLEHLSQTDPQQAKDLRPELKKYTNYAALFTPIAKAYATEIANEVAYDGIQVHGGPGFMKEFDAERYYRDARITNIYEGTTQLQVVAAIGGIMTGEAMQRIREYEAELNFAHLSDLHKTVKDMADLLEKSIAHVREKGDSEYQEYHARRLMEMTTYVFIGYLMLRDASFSFRKKEVVRYFLEFAAPDVKMKADLILKDVRSLIDNHNLILDGAN